MISHNVAPPSHPAIPADVHADILQRLARAEAEHGVRILLAVESGSRAWGFASPNSDYDVRFIYAREPRWYQAVDLEERRDVIEYPIVDDIDLNGWDLRKALRLFWKSNPAFVEWVQSPIRYIERGGFGAGARALLPQAYSVESGMYHYRSMAKNTERAYLREPQVSLKKYFYALRPLLAVLWLERYATPAPIEFDKLLHLIDDRPDLRAAIDDLLTRKRAAPESWVGDPIPVIGDFATEQLARLEAIQPAVERKPSALPGLNALFHAVLDENLH
ncbi:MAG: nucleotidyltransferase domain-containing protein [Lysobacter sp.]|nr:nucleotidyltransferase domain-containing protein [Lysobacter sp.]